MRISENFKVHEVANEHIILAPGIDDVDMTRAMSFNESAMMLYTKLRGRDFEEEDVVRLLMEEYDVDEEVATADAKEWIKSLKDNGLIEV